MASDQRILQPLDNTHNLPSSNEGGWMAEVYDSGMALARDAWKVAETGGETVLHDLHITNGPAVDAYGFSNFVHDHHTAVNYGIDCAAAVAGGATFVATSPFIGPGGILAGAGAGAGMESGLHYLIGDQVTTSQVLRGAIMGGGAAAAVTLEAAVASRFGPSIAAWSGRSLGGMSPALEAAAVRVLMPASTAVTRPGLGQIAAFGADRARASLYSHLSTGTFRAASDTSQQIAQEIMGR